LHLDVFNRYDKDMIHVLKAGRTYEPFSEQKVMDSIRRARIPRDMQADLLTSIKSKLYDGISTQEIYQHILDFLHTSSKPYTKSRYSLKEAIMQLGPTGYPFEDFISKLFEAEGYKTRVRQTLFGRCISHEIDVVVEKDGKTAIIEAKFHNSPGTRSEVQTALYTQARFEDVKIRNHIDEVWLVTNTKTTVDANTYAQCMGMRIMSWDFPFGASLREMVEQKNLHPVTALTSLAQSQKMTLLENHIVLCRDIIKRPELLEMLYLSKLDAARVLDEVTSLSAQE
jgi:restriction endonuclease